VKQVKRELNFEAAFMLFVLFFENFFYASIKQQGRFFDVAVYCSVKLQVYKCATQEMPD